MEKPKTVKALFKMLIAICETDRLELKGIEKLTESEYYIIGSIRAGIQNDLSDNEVQGILVKLKLKED